MGVNKRFTLWSVGNALLVGYLSIYVCLRIYKMNRMIKNGFHNITMLRFESRYFDFLSYLMKMKIMDKRAETLGLSLREREVLNHLAEGKTNVEISCLLRISVRTVEKHLERVYAKLGVKTRTGAMVELFRHQIGISPEHRL